MREDVEEGDGGSEGGVLGTGGWGVEREVV